MLGYEPLGAGPLGALTGAPSSGGTSVALAASLAGSSAVTASLTVTHPGTVALAAGTGAVSSVVGTLTVVHGSGTRTVTDVLKDVAGNILANLTGLKFIWWDQSDPTALGSPTTIGTLSTNSSGVFSITVNTALGAGGVGTLCVTNSDGTTTQTGIKAFIAPHAVV